MKISDLNVGDLVRFNYPHSSVKPSELDLGVVLIVDYDEEEVGIHWRDEEEEINYHPHDEVEDWWSRGMLEVVSESS
jgi:hypothetical protein